jgi:hypothetical protein
MPTVQHGASDLRKPLRVWPGVVIATVVVLIRFIAPLIVPDAAMYGVIVAALGMVGILLWWLLFSRAPWSERLAAVALMAGATAVIRLVAHESIATGMMGFMVPVYAVPATLGPAFVAWAVAARRLPQPVRGVTMAATILLACAVWVLVRSDGVTGEGLAQLAWRWTPTPEQRLLAQTREPEAALPAAPAQPPAEQGAGTPEVPRTDTPPAGEAPPAPATAEAAAATPKDPVVRRADWPGFRGPARDDVVRGVRIEPTWSLKPPVELWRRPIGPAWSSFAVHGDLVYTQEQRGDDEMVTCYRLATGEPVWAHRDPVRFYESNGGPGPRATPTLHDGRVYTVGATGLVNALDAGTGAVVWSRNGAADTGAPLPEWGFAGSPLAIGDTVVVALSGRLIGYDAATGEPRWRGPIGLGGGYSSPHLVRIDGVDQILLLRGGGVTSFGIADGSRLWEQAWQEGVGIIQPAMTEDGDVLISAGDMMGGVGLRRLAVARDPSGGWTVTERWASRGLKPYFNDLVVHKGHAYGFDGSILAAVDVGNGERKWKGGRFGNGQFLLLPEQDILLVLSEEGELALVSATPDKFTELARFKAIEGKTWNHPVLVGDVLLVRNGEEMAAFRIPARR